MVRLALGDGWLSGAGLGEGLTRAAEARCDRPNRWAISLADAAAPSSGHADGVNEAIALVWPALGARPPAKLVPLLRLHDELLAAGGGRVAASVRPALEGLAGSGGQAGRIARSLLTRGADSRSSAANAC